MGPWPRAGYLLSLILAACTLPLGSMGSGRIILVTDPSDTGGTCPGPTCTLRAAWDHFKLNDTIVLNVSATLSKRLSWAYYDAPAHSHNSITFTAARPGLSVTSTGDDSFLALEVFSGWVWVTLQGFTLSGFNNDGQTGSPLICVDQAGTDCGLNVQPYAPLLGRAPGRAGPTEGQRSLWEDKGEVPPPHPSVLMLQDMEISNNHYRSSNRKGMLYTACTWTCSSVFSNLAFKNNSIFYDDPMGGVLHSQIAYGPTDTSLYMKNVEVVGNKVHPVGHFSEKDALIAIDGTIYARDLRVVGNSMGQGLGVLSTGKQTLQSLHGEMYLQDSTFADNMVFPRGPGLESWTLVAYRAHLKRVNIESGRDRAIWTIGDQYLSACNLTTVGGATPLLEGKEFFNRDPYTTLGALYSPLGFANCTSASPVLPCPLTAPTCTDLFGPDGSSVGYSCTQRK